MIQIGETGYYIDSTPTCMTLTKWDGTWRTRSNGRQEESNTTVWYYSTLESLLTGLAEKMTLDAVQKATDISGLREELAKIKLVIEKFARDTAPNIDTDESEDDDE